MATKHKKLLHIKLQYSLYNLLIHFVDMYCKVIAETCHCFSGQKLLQETCSLSMLLDMYIVIYLKSINQSTIFIESGILVEFYQKAHKVFTVTGIFETMQPLRQNLQRKSSNGLPPIK